MIDDPEFIANSDGGDFARFDPGGGSFSTTWRKSAAENGDFGVVQRWPEALREMVERYRRSDFYPVLP